MELTAANKQRQPRKNTKNAQKNPKPQKITEHGLRNLSSTVMKIPSWLILPAVFGAPRCARLVHRFAPRLTTQVHGVDKSKQHKFYTAVHTAHYRFGYMYTRAGETKKARIFSVECRIPGTRGTAVVVVAGLQATGQVGQPCLDRARRVQCRRSD